MAQKASSVRVLIVLFMAFSYVLSCAAVPSTRSLKSNEEGLTVQDLQAQDAMGLRDGGDLMDVGEGFVEGRMDLEIQDYKGAGANTDHEPKTPGRG
ncbi:hypothetical protein FH972_017725 [Carpinus fangiana]|uniref:Uncharacterized protein n=1 Tax=Carpinus fangiana TaxID=176857 RepID=A0A5N6RK25_9ROSI|nr:hypothetical protein FH972_017725 [Carpinus fangiana]